MPAAAGPLPPLHNAPAPGIKKQGGRGRGAADAPLLDFAGEDHAATRHALVLRPLSRGTEALADDGLQNSVPVLVQEGKSWGGDAGFDPTETGSFPPKAPEWFPVSDYVDTDGPDLPPKVHPFGWVPDRSSSVQGRSADPLPCAAVAGGKGRPGHPKGREDRRGLAEQAGEGSGRQGGCEDGGGGSAPGAEAAAAMKPDALPSRLCSYSVRPQTGHQPPKTTTTMELELFDDPELEPLDLEKELAKLAAAGQAGTGLPAASRFFDVNGKFTWRECHVVGYDRRGTPSPPVPSEVPAERAPALCSCPARHTGRCTIRWVSNGRTKQVKRLAVVLRDEDPKLFRFRLRIARRRRVEVRRDELLAGQRAGAAGACGGRRRGGEGDRLPLFRS